jgi:tetratricopeptide (TPR) repeat protein
VNELTLGLLGALLATNQPLAVSNIIHEHTGVAIEVAANPVDRELREVMLADDAAQDEVNAWIQEFESQSHTNKVEAGQALGLRIQTRFNRVRSSYENFLHDHPDHARGHLAYGSFLNDTGDEDKAVLEYEESKSLDPKNPAVWNNLANYYGEHSPVTKAFAYYAQAINLNPAEPVYYHNYGTTVYLFRKDAREYFHLDEQQVFDKALGLYKQAMTIVPDNFVFATDFAESYYGIKPLRTNDALVAWTNAMQIAHTDAEREGVHLHLARVKIAAGFFDEARGHLAAVTNAAYADMKKRLIQSLADHEHPEATETNAVKVVTPDPNVLAPVVLSSNLLTAPVISPEHQP